MTKQAQSQENAGQGYSEQAWRSYVIAYDVDVPQEHIEQEMRLVEADLKHRMVYESMSGGQPHFFIQKEVAEQAEEIKEAALFEAKELYVLRDLAKKVEISITAEELEAEARALAERQHVSLDELRRFFGEDFSMLERSIREQRLRKWALSQDS